MTSINTNSHTLALPIGLGNSSNGVQESNKPLRQAVSSILTYLFSNPPFLPSDFKSKDVSRRHTLLSLSADDPEDYLVTDCYPSTYGNTPTRSIELLRQLTQEVEQMGHSKRMQDSSSLISNPRYRLPERDCILAAVDLGQDNENPLLTLILRLEGDEDDFKSFKFDNLLPCDVVPTGWHVSIEKAQNLLQNQETKLEVPSSTSEGTKARSYSIVTSTTASAYSTASTGQEANDEEGSVESDQDERCFDADPSYDENLVRRKPINGESTNTTVDDEKKDDDTLYGKEETSGANQKSSLLCQSTEEENRGGAEYYTDPKDFWAGTGDDDEANEGDQRTQSTNDHQETEEDRQRREKEEEERYWAMYDNQKSTIDQDTDDPQDDRFVVHNSSILEDLVQNTNMIDDHQDKEDGHSTGSGSQDEVKGNCEENTFNLESPGDQKPEIFHSSTDVHYGEDPEDSVDGPLRPKFNKSSSFIFSQLEGSVINEDKFSDVSEKGSVNDHDTVTGTRTPYKSHSRNFDSTNRMNGEQDDDQRIRQEEVLLQMNGENTMDDGYEDEQQDGFDDRFRQEVSDSIKPLGGYRDRSGRAVTPPSPSLHPSDTFLADGASDASMSVMRSSIHERQRPRSTMLFQLRSSNSNRARNVGPNTTRIERLRNFRPTRESASTTQQAHHESIRISQRQREVAHKIKNRNESIKMIIKGAWRLMGDQKESDGGLERMNENDFLRLTREAIRECVEERS